MHCIVMLGNIVQQYCDAWYVLCTAMTMRNVAQHCTDQPLAGEYLEQLDELFAVPQVEVQVPDAGVDADQMGIHPFHERLLLHVLTLIWNNKNSG